jgi:hypothetical protein
MNKLNVTFGVFFKELMKLFWNLLLPTKRILTHDGEAQKFRHHELAG